MAIIETAKLKTFLRYDEADLFVEETAQLAIEVAAGWLSGEGVTLPATLVGTDGPLFSWVLELAGIAYENPTSMSTDQSGETTSAWADRRLQILAGARRWAAEQGTAPASSVPAPIATFPAPYLSDPFGGRR